MEMRYFIFDWISWNFWWASTEDFLSATKLYPCWFHYYRLPRNLHQNSWTTTAENLWSIIDERVKLQNFRKTRKVLCPAATTRHEADSLNIAFVMSEGVNGNTNMANSWCDFTFGEYTSWTWTWTRKIRSKTAWPTGFLHHRKWLYPFVKSKWTEHEKWSSARTNLIPRGDRHSAKDEFNVPIALGAFRDKDRHSHCSSLLSSSFNMPVFARSHNAIHHSRQVRRCFKIAAPHVPSSFTRNQIWKVLRRNATAWCRQPTLPRNYPPKNRVHIETNRHFQGLWCLK